MDIKDVKLKKGMRKEEVNELISKWVLLEDDVYMGIHHKHNWKCKCGNIIFGRRLSVIKMGGDSILKCKKCVRDDIEINYKEKVEHCGNYQYIRAYFKGDVLPSGKIVGNKKTYIRIRHTFCGYEYEIFTDSFINGEIRCSKCCGSYEKSLAYHIEQELGEPLEKYWDFEKNTLNPYHISKGTHKKVWIKCKEKDYHESYEVSCGEFIRSLSQSNEGCPYCVSKKVHPKDSFAQYHIDNTDKDFLEKYLDYDKNIINPWAIAPNSNKYKVWIKCQNEEVNELNGLMKKDYHGSYEILCGNFSSGRRCNKCNAKTYENLHTYDSFGYHNVDKAQSWSSNNNISPFKVARLSIKKYEFICPNCFKEFKKPISYAQRSSVYCKECALSIPETRILRHLQLGNIKYVVQKEYDGLMSDNKVNLRYDFYLPEYNLLIEYQGEYHDGSTNGKNKTFYDLNKQQEHDRRKREYAEKHGIKLLEIWYWDFDNIEEILNKELISSNKLI